MKNWQKGLFLLLIGGIFFSGADFVFAKKTFNDASSSLQAVVERTAVVRTPGTGGNIYAIAGNTANWSLSIIGVVFFIFMVYAGMKWLTSRGNEEAVKKAQNTMVGASIGLMVILASYAITNLIFSRLVTDSINTSGTGGVEANGSLGTEQGCCIDRVGQKVWAARIDTRYMCETLQGNDGYSGPEDSFWFFYANIKKVSDCLEKHKNCFDSSESEDGRVQSRSC